MGEAAGSLSDLVVLTSDNPRSEDPLRIINDVVVGLQKVNAKYRIEPDREQALEIALDEARRETSCCWRAKVTRPSRFFTIARSNLTIAKRRARFCAAKVIRSITHYRSESARRQLTES